MTVRPQLQERRVIGANNKNQVSQEIRVDLGQITVTKREFKIIRDIMQKWDIDIGGLAKYSLMSIVKAHDGEFEEEEGPVEEC